MKFRFVNVLWNNPHTPERFRLRSFHISIIYFILYFKPAAHDRQVVMTVWCVTPGCLSSIEYFHSSCFSHDRKIRFQDRPSLFVFREKKKKKSPQNPSKYLNYSLHPTESPCCHRLLFLYHLVQRRRIMLCAFSSISLVLYGRLSLSPLCWR